MIKEKLKSHIEVAQKSLKDFFVPKPDFEKLHAMYLKHDAFSSLLHYDSYDFERDLYVNRDAIGFVLEVSPLGGSDEVTYSQLQGLFQHLLPLGSHLQVLLIASNKLYDQYDAWSDARSGSIYHDLAKKRIEYLKSQTQYTPVSEFFAPKDISILLSYSVPSKTYNKFEAEKVLNVKKKMLTLLKSVHANPNNIAPKSLKMHLSKLLDLGNGFYNEEEELSILDPLNMQMVRDTQGFDINSNGIYQQDGKHCLKTFQVNRYPRHWVQSFMDHFIGDPFNDFMQINCPFFLHYGVHIVDDPGLATDMFTKSSRVERVASGEGAKWAPLIGQELAEWQFVRTQFEEGQRVVRTRFQAGLFGDSDYVQEEGAAQLKAVFAANKWGIDSDLAQLPALMSCLPMSWASGAYHDSRFFKKTKTTLSSEPVNLMPLQGEWRGTGSPGVLLFGRRGQPFTFHPFDNTGGNYNVCVLGKSGAGKSVFMQELMFSTLGLGGKVFVFDSGKSFKKVTEIFDGEFIDFGEDEVCINPFNFVNGDTAEDLVQSLITLKSIVATMACNRDVLTDLDLSFIDQAIKHTWQLKGNDGSIDDVVDYFKHHKSKVAQILGEKLFPYSSQGAFGRIFCGTSTLAFNSNIVVLEMGGVNKELLDVVIQILITKINAELYGGDRKTPSHIFLDEGWKFLKGAETKEFIDSSVRQLRKFNGSLVIGTQSLGDLFSNEAASAAYENSDCICYLAQKASSVDHQIKAGRLNLQPYQEKLLKSLKMKQGEYSEVMVTMNDDLYAVGRLKLDPFSNLLYSTKADEFERVKAYVDQGLTVAQSIEKILQEKEN